MGSARVEVLKAGIPTAWEDKRGIHLTNGALEVVFDRTTGFLARIRNGDRELARAEVAGPPSFDVRLDGRWLFAAKPPLLEQYRATETVDAASVDFEWLRSGLVIRERWTLEREGGRLVRQAWARNEGGPKRLFRGFRLAIRGVRPGSVEDSIVVIPGETVIRPRMPLREVLGREVADRFYRADPLSPLVEDRDEGFEAGRLDLPGTLFLPDISPGIVCVHNVPDSLTLVATAYSDSEVTTLWLEPAAGDRLDLVFTNRVETRLARGTEIASGRQYLWVVEGDWGEARRRVAEGYAAISPSPPRDRPDWLTEGAVFEVYAGEYGGFAGLQAQLPRLRELGFDVLYLLPVWDCVRYDDPGYAELELWRRRMDRSWCPQKIPYFISDFYRLDPDLGGEQEFRALIGGAHALGMRVLLDLVMQGCAEDNPLVRDHPDWFVRSLDGEISTSHGWDYYGPNLSLDWANASVQTHFRDLAVHQITAYGADGFRVDAPSWKESNWAANSPRLPSATQFGGHHAMKAIRQAVKAVKPDAGFLCEVPGSLFVGEHDVLNDNRILAMLQLLATGSLTAAELAVALDDVEAVGHPDVRHVYSTENHDSSHWQHSPRGYRGSPIAGCLLALCVLLGDVPLVYSGQELAHAELLRDLLALRKSSAPLLRGKRLWRRPQSPSEDVLTCTRHVDGEAAVIVISFAAESIPTTLEMSASELGNGEAEWTASLVWPSAAAADRTIAAGGAIAIDIELAPYSTYVLKASSVRPRNR